MSITHRERRGWAVPAGRIRGAAHRISRWRRGAVELRRFLILERALDETLETPTCVTGVQFRAATLDDVARACAELGHGDPAAYAERLERGFGSILGIMAGRTVFLGWAGIDRVEPETMRGLLEPFCANDAYLFDHFTHPDFRGRGIGRSGRAEQHLVLRASGARLAISMISPRDGASLAVAWRLGCRVRARAVRVRMGGRIWFVARSGIHHVV